MADIICGGITNSPGTVNSVETIILARFAIGEHNKEATDAGKQKLFEARIYVRAWENFKKVSEFKEDRKETVHLLLTQKEE
ncbi:hypothetical protein GBA52_008564 [Prunus armeniaca]|nr:hypothetical protein GBA52_008564 [Prunus armeniaca]